MKYLLLFFLFFALSVNSIFAVSDPRQFPDNKFGLNSLSPETDINGVSELVNSNGDWGWIVLVIRKNERDSTRWQGVFNTLLAKHLIPIVRIATQADTSGNWERPAPSDASEWANFLSSLNWPTKNKYVQVYNEVNRDAEWGGNADPASYAQELNRTIDELKKKSPDFFILNAPMDLAAGNTKDAFDAGDFLKSMNDSVPGIFDRIDGWASHSYPNPDFSAEPTKLGRTGIDGYKWELSTVSGYSKGNLPVFITETGWKSSTDGSALGVPPAKIGDFYKTAFENVWNDSRVVAVAPFVFSYDDGLFKDFAFNVDGRCREFCQTIKDIGKVRGAPDREDAANIVRIDAPQNILFGSRATAYVEVKNNGNFIWYPGEGQKVFIDGVGLEIQKVSWGSKEVFPGQTVKATVSFLAAKKGSLPFNIVVTSGKSIVSTKGLEVNSDTYFSYVADSLSVVKTLLSFKMPTNLFARLFS